MLVPYGVQAWIKHWILYLHVYTYIHITNKLFVTREWYKDWFWILDMLLRLRAYILTVRHKSTNVIMECIWIGSYIYIFSSTLIWSSLSSLRLFVYNERCIHKWRICIHRILLVVCFSAINIKQCVHEVSSLQRYHHVIVTIESKIAKSNLCVY